MASGLSIGRLAAAAGVNVETIRYYQRRGLLAEPPKPPSGQRRYPPDLTRRVRFIKRAQLLGFTLEEIAGLLSAPRAGPEPGPPPVGVKELGSGPSFLERLEQARACAESRELAQRKLQIIDSKIADLNAMRRALGELVRQCEAPDSDGCCPIIHALTVD